MKTGYLGNTLLKPSDDPIEFSQHQVDELIRCATDIIYFIKNYVKIVNVDRGVMNFEMYPFQEEMVKTFHANRFSICKLPRQQGKSTTVVAYLLHYLLFNDNVSIAILANKASTARELLSKLKFAYELLPKWMQQGVVEWNKGNIELENGSKARAASTTGDSIRGFTFNCVTGDSEVEVKINGVHRKMTIRKLTELLSTGKESAQMEEVNMFIENKYKTVYDAIVTRAKLRSSEVEGEWHHIIPRSMGGSNEQENLVKLTYREHLIVHKLLIKFTEGANKRKMSLALHLMLSSNPSIDRNSHQYQYARKMFIDARTGTTQSDECKRKIGEAHAGRKLPESTKAKLSVANKGRRAGIPISEEHKQKISNALLGHKKDADWVNKVNRNPEKIAKTADAHRGMKRSEEAKEKMRVAKIGYVPWTTGKVWAHNPTTGEVGMFSSVPEGWNRGKGRTEPLTGRQWIHNPLTGQIKAFSGGELPDGFKMGRK